MGGTAGMGGGGVFSIYLYGGSSHITGCRLDTGNGGPGGYGEAGGTGGTGGEAGGGGSSDCPIAYCTGSGGAGSAGGSGAKGGDGGGGGGGPSIGILCAGACSLTESDNTILPGSAGVKGLGPSGNDGEPGLSAEIHQP